jgi:hypothetical protein
LKQLIESEAHREAAIYSQQFQLNTRTVRAQTITASVGLALSSVFEFLKWCVPAILAIYCTYEMTHFFNSDNKEAAGAFEKILYVLITGAALGWAVSKREK